MRLYRGIETPCGAITIIASRVARLYYIPGKDVTRCVSVYSGFHATRCFVGRASLDVNALFFPLLSRLSLRCFQFEE